MIFPASSPLSLNTLPKGELRERFSTSVPLVVQEAVFTARSVCCFTEEYSASVLTAATALRKLKSLFGGKTEFHVTVSLPLFCELLNNTWVLISGSRGRHCELINFFSFASVMSHFAKSNAKHSLVYDC